MKLKVIYLNTFEGVKQPDRLSRIIQFVRSQNPDVLGLSELRDWEKNDCKKLKYFLKKTGYRYSIFARSKNNYHVALLSKYNFIKSETLKRDFRCSAAIGKIKLPNSKILNIVLTHLAARSEDMRLKEVTVVIKKIKLSQPFILMGDMNSLSPNDNYNKREFLKKAKTIGLIKFGTNRIRSDVITRLLRFGMIDATKYFSKKTEYTAPTPYNLDRAHFTNLRLDYIFVTKLLLNSLKSARIIRSKQTDRLSDHYPVIAEFDL